VWHKKEKIHLENTGNRCLRTSLFKILFNLFNLFRLVVLIIILAKYNTKFTYLFSVKKISLLLGIIYNKICTIKRKVHLKMLFLPWVRYSPINFIKWAQFFQIMQSRCLGICHRKLLLFGDYKKIIWEAYFKKNR